MSIHPKDRKADNPRLQCSVCRRWMRLHGRRLEVVAGEVKEVAVQRFYGSCDYTRGDHLAGDKTDVCDACCQVECKKLAGCDPYGCEEPAEVEVVEPDVRVVPCEHCGTEGRLYYEVPSAPDRHGNYPLDYSDECPCCQGTGGEIVEVRPVEMADLGDAS